MRHAFRSLAKSPGFTAIAILTLALGIGLNTSMFSLMNLLMLQPLPFPERDQLVRVYRTTPQSQEPPITTVPDFLDLAREAAAFADLAAYRLWGFTLAPDGPAGGQPQRAARLRQFFPDRSASSPQLGRFFTADEDRPGNHVIILSHATWQAHFGGDPAVVGRTVRSTANPPPSSASCPPRFRRSSSGVRAMRLRPLA